MIVRWTFTDPSGRRPAFTVPINPNEMSSPRRTRSVQVAGQRALEQPASPERWTFGGVLHEQAHYDQLAAWCEHGGRVHITDHLGRTWICQLISFDPEPTRSRKPWRYTYEIVANVYGGP